MYIDRIAIKNYKSYMHNQEIQFTTGFNVIVGANNVGKTALVEALSIQFEDNQHRSVETISTPEGNSLQKLGPSTVNVTFAVTQKELRKWLVDHSPTFYIRKTSNSGEIDNQIQMSRIQDAFLSPEIHIKATYYLQNIQSARIMEMETEQNIDLYCQVTLKDQDSTPIVDKGNFAVNNPSNVVSDPLAKFFSEKIYHFKAERFNVGQHQMGNNSTLKSDASNLAQVLHLLLTSNSARFTKLVDYVKIIFPDIKHIAIPPADNTNMVKILLWYVDSSTERQDLAIPLQESGTGIGQVLAILYVAINSDFPRPIIIDEPQSFLHPAAIRKLFSILSLYPQHQYILTTHSPLVISVTNPTNLILLRKKDTVTQVEKITTSETVGMNAMLQEVGARLSDVFGAENILWVEGATEENSFLLIVQKIIKKPLAGTAILGVVNVGDFEGKKDSQRVLEIYQKLSKAKALMPPAIGFIFDREGRSQTDQADLNRQSNGRVHFLPRRMYENYLLNPNAIFALISELDNFREQPITLQDIQEWIENNRWNSKYYSLPNKTPESWLINVAAGKFLDALFNELSDKRYSYESNKAYYGVQLTSWLVENSPDDLNDIKDLLNTVLGESI